jgi:hypothetical protein
MVNKVYKIQENGETLVAVLVSNGWGAGWSTWNNEYPELLFESEVVAYLLNGAISGKEALYEYLAKKYKNIYMGGFEELFIVWAPEGKEFVILKYDGMESLIFKNEFEWITP